MCLSLGGERDVRVRNIPGVSVSSMIRSGRVSPSYVSIISGSVTLFSARDIISLCDKPDGLRMIAINLYLKNNDGFGVDLHRCRVIPKQVIVILPGRVVRRE